MSCHVREPSQAGFLGDTLTTNGEFSPVHLPSSPPGATLGMSAAALPGAPGLQFPMAESQAAQPSQGGPGWGLEEEPLEATTGHGAEAGLCPQHSLAPARDDILDLSLIFSLNL